MKKLAYRSLKETDRFVSSTLTKKGLPGGSAHPVEKRRWQNLPHHNKHSATISPSVGKASAAYAGPSSRILAVENGLWKQSALVLAVPLPTRPCGGGGAVRASPAAGARAPPGGPSRGGARPPPGGWA